MDDQVSDRRYPPERRSTSLTTPIAIVIAGALIALGIVLAILLRGDPGDTTGGGVSPTATQAAALGSPLPSGSGASAGLTPTPRPADTFGLHNKRPDALIDCDHLDAIDPTQAEIVPEAKVIFDASFEAMQHNHGCGTPGGFYASYHQFTSTEEMNATFDNAFASRLGSTNNRCVNDIDEGQSSYLFPDGRSGRAICARQPRVRVFVAWTEENTNVISILYGTSTGDESAEQLKDFWISQAGPVCRESETGPIIPIAECRS